MIIRAGFSHGFLPQRTRRSPRRGKNPTPFALRFFASVPVLSVLCVRLSAVLLEAQPEPQCALDSLHHCRVSSVSRRRLVGPNTSSSSVVAFGVKGNCPALTIALRCPNRRPGASFQGCLSQIRLWGGTAPLRYRSSTILPLYHHHSNMLAGRCIHRCSQNRLGFRCRSQPPRCRGAPVRLLGLRL